MKCLKKMEMLIYIAFFQVESIFILKSFFLRDNSKFAYLGPSPPLLFLYMVAPSLSPHTVAPPLSPSTVSSTQWDQLRSVFNKGKMINELIINAR